MLLFSGHNASLASVFVMDFDSQKIIGFDCAHIGTSINHILFAMFTFPFSRAVNRGRDTSNSSIGCAVKMQGSSIGSSICPQAGDMMPELGAPPSQMQFLIP